MTVILVLVTFVRFLLIDHFYSRKHAVVEPALPVAKREAPPRLVPSLVGGFQVPENLRFHPGHTWALSESPSLVRVGMDEFASKLAGQVDPHLIAAARAVDSPGAEDVHDSSRRGSGGHGVADRGQRRRHQRFAGEQS